VRIKHVGNTTKFSVAECRYRDFAQVLREIADELDATSREVWTFTYAHDTGDGEARTP